MDSSAGIEPISTSCDGRNRRTRWNRPPRPQHRRCSMTLRVAIYARVSTLHQAQAQTIDQQLERLQAYVHDHGWQLLDEHIFRDDGRSGAELNRPGLDHLRDAARNDELDRVVTAPDRLARN